MNLQPIRISLALVSLLLGGCSMLQVKTEEYATYALDLAATEAHADPVDWQLRVEEPIAATPIAGVKIAQRDESGAFGTFRGARWSERAPELVQGAIVRSLEDSGRIRGVGRATSIVRGDFLLLLELRNFEADYSAAGTATARISISARLVSAKRNEAVGARIFSETEAAHGRDMNAIVGAFKAAAGRLILQLRDWVLETGQANWQTAQGDPPP